MFPFRYDQVRSQMGLTLVELLGVTVILVILSLIALPVYAEVADKSRHSKSCSELTELETEIDRYYVERAQYPTQLVQLVTQGYIKNTALQSPWNGRAYFYAANNEVNPPVYILGDPGLRRECGASNVASACLSNPWVHEVLPANTSLGGVRCGR